MKTAIINSVGLAAALIAAATGAQMISPELLARVTTNAPLELKATAIDGAQIDLSKLRGKVVLLDFWATWCGPCVQEAPKVVATYNKLHDKGFEIVGISLDQNKESVVWFTISGPGPITARAYGLLEARDDVAAVLRRR